MKRADLHIHTTASDGLLPPDEVVRWAQIKRLSAIAITDHDTVAGIELAESVSDKYKVEVIPGIELNTEYEDEEIHILGYFIDYKQKWFIDKLEEIRSSRLSRAASMIHKLNKMGINIDMEQVKRIASDGIIGRPHIARAMQEGGYITHMKEAFSNYIGKDGPAYAERYKLSCSEACEMIKSLGGVPVLAHPGLMKDWSKLPKIIDMGVMGIEVFHSKHEDEVVRNAQIVARNRGLLITGGSDCHGNLHGNEPILGNFVVDYLQVEQLKKTAHKIAVQNCTN